ncbi:MAG: hypothetical protein HY910_12135 [Desulfarculus sp.]|nr:hypothetical protein [Desulfarculus sp.]
MEIELAARDTSGPVLSQFGSTVKRTFEQASQDAAQASKGASLLDRTFGNLADTVRAVGLAFGAYEAARYAQQAVMLAARYETLGVTLQQLGKTAGYSKAFLDQQEEALRKAGITAIGSRESLARMIQANLDLSKSAQLARVAQDAAAISGVNSSEAYKQIVYGIQSAQVEMLRTVGINVSFENSYAAVAAQTGRTAASLTEAEKAQIRLNAVLEAGKGISGAYEAAMGTAGKQILSFQRYAEDLQVELGKAFGPALADLVGLATHRMAQLTDIAKSSAVQSFLQGIGSATVFAAQHLDVLAMGLGVAGAAWLAYQMQIRAATVATVLHEVAAIGLRNSLVTGLNLAILGTGASLEKLGLWVAANPLVALTLAVGTAATAYVALHKSTSDYLREAQQGTQELAEATRAFATSRSEISTLDDALRKLDESMRLAQGNTRLERLAIEELASRYPQLVGTYNTVGEAVANVNAKRQEYLAGLEREAQLKQVELLEKARLKIIEVGKSLGPLALELRNYQAGLDGGPLDWLVSRFQDVNVLTKALVANLKEVRDANAINPSNAEEGRKLERVLEDLLLQLSKIKGIAPEVQKSLELALSGRGSKVVGSADVRQWDNAEIVRRAEQMDSGLDMVGETGSRRPLPDKMADRIAGEWQKTRSEALSLGKAPSEAARLAALEEFNAYSDEFKRLYPGVAENIRALRLAEASKTAEAEKAAHAKGQYEIGAISAQELTALLQQRQAMLAAGNIVERAEALSLQKAITDLTLQGYRDRQAITEAGFNLGREGQGTLIAAYQAELAILPALKMSAEDRARRELELTTKIRDVKEQGFTRELDLNKQRVSWMAEGTAKHTAQLDIQEAEERHHLEVLFAANKDLQDKKKQVLEDYEKFAQRRREEAASKERQQALDVQLQTAKLYGNTRLAKELELAKYAESLKTSGINQIYHEQLIANERVRINRTGVESMLLQWSDFYEGWDKIGENFLQNIQSESASVIKSIAEQNVTVWTGMWTAMKNIAYQAIAAIGSRLLTYGLGQVAISLVPGLAGPLGMSGSGGGLLGMASNAKGAYDLYSWLSGGGGSSFGTPGGFGSNLFTWGQGEGAIGIEGLSGLGYGAAGIGGALSGWQIANLLYGGKGYSGLGGAIGGAAGGIGGGWLAGSAAGLALGPWGAVGGALLGGLLGGTGGGFLGSLFGEDEDTPEYEMAGHPEAHWKELSARVEDLTQRLKDGKLTQDDFNSTLAGLAPLAAGAGDYLGGYGKIVGGTIEALGQLTQGTQEYADKVNTELNPAWIIATGLAQNLADGMDKLDANKKALSDAIDALAASSGLSADQQSQLVDLVIRQSGSVAELTDKYNRYNEIKQQLANAHDMERGQVEALGAELRALHDELGIAANPMDNLTKVTGSLDKTMQSLEKTMRAIFNLPSDKEFNITTNYHQNGTPSAHGGSLVSAALAHGYITRHGGGPAPFYAHAGNPAWDAPKPGEVDIRALMGEWVIQPAAVDFYGNDFMAAINDMRVPVRTGASGGSVPLAAAGPPVIQPYFDFRGASFGSDPQETAQLIGDAVDDRLRALMADMDYRGENPAVRHRMGVDS